MRMSRKAVSAAGASIAMAFLAACSDSPTAPVANPRAPQTPSFAIGDVLGAIVDDIPAVGRFTICKSAESNVSGTFAITGAPVLGGGGSVFSGDLVVAPGTCRIAAIGNNVSGTAFRVSATETSPGFVAPVVERSVLDENGAAAPGPVLSNESNVAAGLSYDINLIHGYRLTYTNTVAVPDDVCDFSTFGGFVLLPNNISYGGNAGFASSGFAYGDLNFVDHTTGDHIHVWNVTDYGHPDTGPLSQYEDSRLAFGKGTINGAGSFDVEFRFLDSGEPAKKLGDVVYLIVNGSVLIPEQTVDGGNIQLHKNCKKAPKAEKH